MLLSDGKENRPENPDDLHGAYTAARAAKDQGVPISTISFGTKGGYVAVKDQRVAVPVDDSMMQRIAQLSGGQTYSASNIDELNRSYAAVQQQVGYQTVPGPASAGWLRWPSSSPPSHRRRACHQPPTPRMTAAPEHAVGRQIPLRWIALRPWSGLVPHGGGAVATVIAGVVIAVIAATIALEQGRSARTMFGAMITAFVVTFLVVSAGVHFRA